ncbi:MAG: DUF1194 domain-containing protein [Rhodospirillales bacterium]
MRPFPLFSALALPLALTLFLILGLSVLATGPLRAEPVDLELVLAADGSGSIDDDELRLQREGYAAAIQHPKILDAIRGGYHQKIALAFVEWGAPWSQHTIVDWTVIDGPESAARFADALLAAPRMAESYNSISEAIVYSVNLIESNVYQGRRKIIDISGDGPQMNGRPLPEAKALAMLAGITINALVVYKPGGLRSGPYGEPLIDHYQNDVIGGRGAFAHMAEGREQFAPAILKKMILEIAEAVRQ